MAAIATALRAVGALHGGDPDKVAPWFFPSVAEYRRLLEQGGFAVRAIMLVPRPTTLDIGIRGWLETFGRSSSSNSTSPNGGKYSPRSSSFCTRRFAMLTACGRPTISGSALPRSGLGEGRPHCPRHTDARFMAEALAYQGRRREDERPGSEGARHDATA